MEVLHIPETAISAYCIPCEIDFQDIVLEL